MSREALRLTRNILLRSFVIGLVIVFLLGLATVTAWPTWAGLASQWFHADETVLTRLVLGFFLNVRFFLLFIVLAPALGIHWTLKSDKMLK